MSEYNMQSATTAEALKPAHYYGDTVRLLFLSAAFIMLIGLPTIKSYLSLPTIFSVAAILALGLVAGLTNPRQVWEAGLNAALSLAGFLVFESYAVMAYEKYSPTDKFFVANLALSLIFMLAIYFSVKTFRGLLLEKQESIKAEQQAAAARPAEAKAQHSVWDEFEEL